MPRPPFPRRSNDEEDPTGIHDLLSSLPDPGPMPADLTRRISETLAREQQERGIATGPWVDRPPSKRFSTGKFIAGLAAAAAVTAVAAVGINAVGGMRSTTSSDSTQADLTQATQHRSGGGSPAPAPAAEQEGASAQGQGRAAVGGYQTAGILILTTGREYTSASLATRARDLIGLAGSPGESNASRSAAPQPTASWSAGPASDAAMASPHVVRDCLATQSIASAGEVVVDLAEFEGRPAAVVVTLNRGTRRAHVVSRDCGVGPKQRPMAGPVVLAGP